MPSYIFLYHVQLPQNGGQYRDCQRKFMMLLGLAYRNPEHNGYKKQIIPLSHVFGFVKRKFKYIFQYKIHYTR